MNNGKIDTVYDKDFYMKQRTNNNLSAEIIVPIILDLYRENTGGGAEKIVDLGCGTGNWLDVYKKAGCKVLGIDGGNVSKELLMIEQKEFKVHDLTKRLKVSERFDIASSLEVAEHLPRENADEFVKTLTQLSDVIVFSAAIPHQRGAHHVNEQYPSYWIQKFAKYDYKVVDCIRRKIWGNKEVRSFYAQNIFLFCANTEQNKKLIALSRDDCAEMYDLVHPRIWEELNNFSFMKIIDKLHDNKLIYKFYCKFIKRKYFR